MKVKLATQLLSDSVAKAIEHCDQDLQMIEFQGCEETVYFIRTVNRCFDILNSHSQSHPGYKKAISEKNINSITQFINEAVEYLKTIKSENRSTGFVGFIIDLKNTISLYEE